MTKTFGLSFIIFLLLWAFGCQRAQETKPKNAENSSAVVQPPQPNPEMPKTESVITIDVPKLAHKSAEEVDKILGPPFEIKNINEQMPGEFRLYKFPNYPKGLAVRFVQNKAVSFNLILSKPLASSKEALKQVFNIDVGAAAPARDKNEPLTEKWQGTFSGVKFGKVAAKRENESRGFIFLLAEVAQ
jgi:hypothetical protein